MSRFFAPITIKDFQSKVKAAFYDVEDFDHHKMKERMKADMKVNFDFENFDMGGDGFGPKSLIGYLTLSNGMTILGMSAGGDWEYPVYFCLYWDGKKIRCYIPTDGNPWNTDTKEAYGNDDEADLKNAKKRWPNEFKDATEVDVGDFEFDPIAIEKDIIERIKPLADPLSLEDKVEALKFYGTGDEAYELFCATCSLCYQMYGLGQTEKANTLYKWAKEQAKASAEDIIDENDFEMGCFDYR